MQPRVAMQRRRAAVAMGIASGWDGRSEPGRVPTGIERGAGGDFVGVPARVKGNGGRFQAASQSRNLRRLRRRVGGQVALVDVQRPLE